MTIYYTNHLEKLLKLYPDKPWDYAELSYNPNITWDIVKNNPDKPWNYFDLSQNDFEKHDHIQRRHNIINAKYYLQPIIIKDIIFIIVSYL